MKNLQELFNESLNDVKMCGILPGKIQKVSMVNYKGGKTWGKCYYIKNDKKWENCTYRIEINEVLLDDSVPDTSVKNTLIHEILHTCKGCMNHGVKWKTYADVINYTYEGKYHISRTNSHKELSVKFDENIYNYVITCKKCGTKIGYTRVCKILYDTKCGFVNCKCGGKFELTKTTGKI